MKDKYFVSIIWGYHKYFYDFAEEEHYHIHALKIAKDMGYKTIVILRGEKNIIENDPIFPKDIKVFYYKNIFNYIYTILKYSLKGAVFYVNSVEPQSLIVPLLAKKTIFMGHTHPKRQTWLKQKIFNISMNLFSKIRLNNETEKEFLLNEGIKEEKLKVIPLSISLNDYRVLNENSERKDLVYFGNITHKKNLPTIIKACNIVHEKYPDIKLHVIGKEYEKIIENNIEVIRYGFIKEAKDVSVALNKFIVYINSSFDEGQCVAVYNAALSGCTLCLPKIMSFTGVFKDKALFHDTTDHKQLAENIKKYLEDKELSLKHNKLCRDMIIKNYSYTEISDKMRELFTF